MPEAEERFSAENSFATMQRNESAHTGIDQLQQQDFLRRFCTYCSSSLSAVRTARTMLYSEYKLPKCVYESVACNANFAITQYIHNVSRHPPLLQPSSSSKTCSNESRNNAVRIAQTMRVMRRRYAALSYLSDFFLDRICSRSSLLSALSVLSVTTYSAVKELW